MKKELVPHESGDRVTCGVLLDVGGPSLKISVRGEIIAFEMHPYCGPILIGKNGDPLYNQRPDHFFWTAVSYWAQQGQRMDNGVCVWDYPPEPITRHLGGRHYLLTGYTESRRGS